MLWTLPNILTMSRIAVIPLLIASYFMDQPLGSHLAVAMFTLASITDFLDGYIARKMGIVSRFGQFLDPIADKLMIGAVVIMVVAGDTVTGVHVVATVIIMCRELLVSGLREFLAGLQVGVPVTMAAKWKTTIQMFALGALVWHHGGESIGLPAQEIGLVLLWSAAALTLYTGFDYMRAGLKHMVQP